MFITRIAFGLACLGVLVPQGLGAATPAETATPDITLGAKGELLGRLVDTEGEGLADREVVIQRGRRITARLRTDKAGRFTTGNLPGGLYLVSAGSTQLIFRAWTSGSAPPKASEEVVLVERVTLVAAQGEAAAAAGGGEAAGIAGLSAIGVATVVAVAIAVPVAISESNKDDPPPASP